MAAGVVDVAAPRASADPVTLRYSQLERILGIEIPADEVPHPRRAGGERRVGRFTAGHRPATELAA
ncbi:MAG: hypothetical protein R3C10_08315 [Pirellulales bacterium]